MIVPEGTSFRYFFYLNFDSMYKVVEIEDVGPVLFKKDRRYKRLSMKVDGEARVIVNLPYGISSSVAKDWVIEKKGWILRSTAKVVDRKKNVTLFVPDTVYKTFQHTIEFVRSDKPDLSFKQDKSFITIGFGNNMSEEEILGSYIQDNLRGVVESIYKHEAKYYLVPRTKEIAKELGFKHGRITVRNNKTRWGSCSHEDNISLNIHLMRLPKHLIDYVIIHELCHTIEKNHSQNFWDLMEKVCPNSKGKRKELGQYSTVLY